MSKQWKPREIDAAKVDNLIKKLHLSPMLAQALVARGVDDTDLAEDFLHPKFLQLVDPSRFIDMDKAKSRLALAITSGETIGIFGDYDVDGVCSAALLQQFLLMLNANVVATLPNRMSEGYGLSKAGVERLHARGASLIVTVDCGISAHENIAFANGLNIEVIVVDHHEVGETLPEALAIVNPKRPDCGSDASYLCAAGVTFFLCLAIRQQLRADEYFIKSAEPDVRELLDLVALATICDVVPLVKNNRILTKAGLHMIKQKKRVGLAALMDVCGIDAQKISSTNLGFHLGPRINAAGRLEDAHDALLLLSTKDNDKARTCAEALHATNSARKSLEDEILNEAIAMVHHDPVHHDAGALVLYHENWHPGVVGIVASRVAEKFHKPAIIIGQKGKGSGRSIKGIDLHAMVSKASQSLLGFGGHAHAIGLTLGEAGVDVFRNELTAVIASAVSPQVYRQELYYDGDIALNEISLSLIDELLCLEPFGMKNPHVVLRVNQAYMRNIRRLLGGHIKGELETMDGIVSFIGFRMVIDDALVGQKLDFLGVLEKNEWQGRITPQLRLIDFKPSL